jgi:hypothetical protein
MRSNAHNQSRRQNAKRVDAGMNLMLQRPNSGFTTGIALPVDGGVAA